MKTSNVQLDFLHESYSVALYDMRIKNVEERVSKRLVFDKAIQAANFLGIIPKNFYDKIGVGKYITKRGTSERYTARKITKIHEIENKAHEATENRVRHTYIPGVPRKPKFEGKNIARN